MRTSPPATGGAKLVPLRRALLVGLTMGVALMSCGREPTAPHDEPVRYARGISFRTIFPEMAKLSGSIADLVTFVNVHVVLRRLDGSVAVDTTVNFPANANSVTLSLNIRLSAGAPATGEPLMLDMSYLNAAGVTVFHAGPIQILAVPTVAGQGAPDPITVEAVYTGPGATAKSVRISPRSLNVNAGAPFAFSAVALDAGGAVVPNTPIVWSSLDPTRAAITASDVGNGTTLPSRGAARIVAQLLTLQADTVIVNVSLPATSISAVSGNAQTGVVGKQTLVALPQPLVVKVAASDGSGVAGQTVTFAVVSGAGTLSASSVATDASGLAQTTWSLGSVGSQTVTASVASLSGSPVTFTATGQTLPAVKLALTAAPAAGASVATSGAINLVVSALDKDNDVVTGFTGNVSIALSTNPTSATLGGTTTVAAVKGVATFANVMIPTPGTGYVLTASSTGLPDVSTPAFNVVTGAAANLVLLSGNAQAASTGTALAPITVLATDVVGNAKAGVDVAFAVTSGGGSVAPANALTDAAGKATATWTLGSAIGAQTLTATVAGLPPVVVTATATSATNHLVFATQPSATNTAGVVLSPPIVVEIRDPANQLFAGFTGAITLSIANNPGSSTLGGTTTVNAVGGVATFDDITLDKIGSGYTLTASTTGAPSATSSAFAVQAGAAASIALVSGNNQVGTASTVLPQPIVAKVQDALGNPVQGASVAFVVANGGGSVGSATATTNAAGLATSTWTLGSSGTQTLSVSSGTLTGSPITVDAVIGSTGTVATTTLSPKVDTLTAIGDTRQINAQARDATGSLVAGNWTWTSRSPQFVSVTSTGLVQAETNGTSWIVATEAGGTKDSAMVTTQQRVASVNVSPSSKSLYVTGLGSFSAQAVDGRGVPIATQPTFTWSSTAPAVATVNASTGAVSALTIGSTQIRATAGSAVGVANLSVLSPITRIDVTFDSTNAPAPDNYTMTALGQQRMYRAIARDTLNVVMSGISFTWASTNPSVAAIDSTTSTQARATASANGVTSIQATAQGVTGGAILNVAQVLSSIDLQPTSLVVGVGGQATLIARGKDSNGRFISGGSFVFTSAAPTVVSVNSSGVVTGLAQTSTNPVSITAANGAITSNAALVNVNNSGPAIISFGRDTLGIGRGATVSIPVFLSKPNGTAVTVNLSVRDTNAYFSAASVTIPAGQTAVNATLNARNAGSTLLYAADGSGTGYSPDTAVLNIQATMRLTNGGYSVNATDQVSTQVLLSDPSPASGTYVTFSYTNANIAQVSPDPAFIPPGQLASNIVIRGLAAGSTSITPVAAGVTGTASSVNVGAAILTFNLTSSNVGAGQFEPNTYVYIPNSLNNPLTISLRSTDTTVATVVPSVTIPAGTNYLYFNWNGKAAGVASIIATAAGWTPDTLIARVSSPRVTISGGTSLTTTSGPRAFTVYSADSLRSVHSRVNSLAVRVSSSDPSVINVLDTLVTIPAGQYYNNVGQITPGGTGGSAYVKVTASGHTPDSTLYTVTGPALSFSYNTNRLGAGQQTGTSSYYVQIPNAVATPLVVTLANSDSSKAATSPTVTIPAGSNYVYFQIRGKSPGTSSIVATAAGYRPDTAITIVTTPRISLNGGGSINAYSQTNIYVYPKDSTGGFQQVTQPLTVHFTSTDTTLLKVDSVATIPAGGGNTQPPALLVSFGGTTTQTAKIIATAPGHAPDTATWTILPAKLQINFTTFTLGARQHQLPTDFYVYTNQGRPVSVPVTLTQKSASVVALSTTSLTIPANNNYAYFSLGGLAAGRDTIIASAPGYQPDTAFVTVTTPRFSSSIPGTANTTSPPSTITVYATDSLGNSHYTSDTVVVMAVSSDSNVMKPSQTYFRILKDAYYAQPQIVYVGAGTATLTLSDSANSGYRSYTTNAVTVTGPSLLIAGGNGMLGMRQYTSPGQYYVYTANNVSSALTVNLASSSTRVATVNSSVTIPAGSNYAYFTITALDTIGTIQIQATASGYSPANVNMQVTQPKIVISTGTSLNTTSAPNGITLYATDQNGTSHYNVDPVTLTLASSATGVATIDSTQVTIPAGASYHYTSKWIPGSVGTAQLSATDPRAAYYKYTTGTVNVSVVTPAVTLAFGNFALGIDQYTDGYYVYVPDTRTTPLTVSITHGATPRTTTVSSVTIPVGTNYQYFRIAGTSAGLDTITVSATGHTSTRGTVTVAPGRLDPISGWPTSIKAGDSVQVTMYVRDAQQSVHYAVAATTFTLAPNANIEFVSGGANSAVITSVTVPVDAQYVQFYLRGKTAGTGTANITNAKYTTYTNTVTVTP